MVVGLVMTVIGMGAFDHAYTQTDIPNPNAEFETETTFVDDADGKTVVGRFATQNRESTPTLESRRNIKLAVVAAEDQSFWTNKGIDPKGIIRAAFSNARGNSTQGGSGITQQYVKNAYLSDSRTLKRKLQEPAISVKLDHREHQAADPGLVPEHHLLRSRGLRHPGGGRDLLRRRRQGAEPQAERRPGQRAERSQRPRSE